MPGNLKTELTTIGSLFAAKQGFKVPIYQRDYSWEARHLEQFWDDLIDTVRGQRTDHFLGSLVFNDSEKTQIQIIDGQQRLATASILIASMRDLLAKENDKDRANLYGDLLGHKDISTLKIRPRVELNETNDETYQTLIVSETSIADKKAFLKKAPPASNQLLIRAYIYLYEKLSEYFDGTKQSVSDFAVKLHPVLMNRLECIAIYVQENANAFLIFETLNDRGLALSIADLLKNFFFMGAETKTNLEKAKKYWDEMSTSLENKDISQYVRHYWISTIGVVREKDLYAEIVRAKKDKAQILDFLDTLRKSSEIYAALSDADHALWKFGNPAHANKTQAAIREIQAFRLSQCNIVLLAAAETLNEAQQSDVFDFIRKFTFRYSIICQRGTGNLEKAFSDIALFIRNKKSGDVTALKGIVKGLLPSEDEFKRDFIGRSFTSASIARHILAEVNNSLSKPTGMKTGTHPADLNLEHIMPKKVTAEWAKSFAAPLEPKDFINRLGNMTLLNPKVNNKGANGSFVEKAKLFVGNDLEITKPLLAQKTWGPKEIEGRQAWLYESATKVWSL